MTILERFEAKYEPEPNSGCWLYSAIRLLALSLLLAGCIAPFPAFGPDGYRLNGQRYVNITAGYLGAEDLRQDFYACTLDGQTDPEASACLNAKGWRVVRR